MNPTVHSYINRDEGMPPDPCPTKGDLSVKRMPGRGVYSILPLSFAGRDFVVRHHEAGIIDGECLMVRQREIFPFMNEVFDAGVKVV